MPVPIQRLVKEHKLSPDDLKRAFDAKTIEKRPLVKKLVDNIRDTIKDGIQRNRSDYRLFKAMDWAYDTPFYQISYTQLRGLLSNKGDDNKVREMVNEWGLAHLLPDMMENGKCCLNSDGTKRKALNLPVFFNIFVPICMAYVTIRWAKLFNDRNLNPLYKYEPSQFTRENRFRCEVLTQIVQRQATWFDYAADLKQTILQTLNYGYCISFPREAWFCEKQEDENGKVKVIREGLRYNMPHPSRTYYDLYHRLSSLNSNSGCEYAGYWELCRYKDIHDNPLYWNKDAISLGAMGWFDIGKSDFLQQVYPCQFQFPTRGGNAGVGDLDRLNEAARSYGQGDFNAATLKSEHFQRLIPADHGLGTYKYPVWFRFLYASDSAVIWCEPLAYSPAIVHTYDADFNRSRFRSLNLEIIPFQDQISNLLTQWILAVKENLINPVFYDKEKIPAAYLTQLENLGQKLNNGRPFIPFSSTENYRMKLDQREAFYSPQLTHHQTGDIASLIQGVLGMLDRVMQLSPQEIGQAASHEQTAEESRIIASNTSTRVTFTGTGIDSGEYARKVQIYDATMAYHEEDLTVGVTSSLAGTKAEFDNLLKAVGFENSQETPYDENKPEMMHTVTGKKSALTLETFASTRDGQDRINVPGIADAMSKIFLAIAGNPVLIQSVGPVQLVELLNQIIQASGVPQEFRLKGKMVETANPEEQSKQVAQMMQQFAEKVQALVAQKQQETLQLSGQQTAQIVGKAMQASQAETAQVVQQGDQQAQAAMQKAAPVIEQAQQAAAMAAQKLLEHEQQIQALNSAVDQLAQVIQQSAPPPPQPMFQP